MIAQSYPCLLDQKDWIIGLKIARLVWKKPVKFNLLCGFGTYALVGMGSGDTVTQIYLASFLHYMQEQWRVTVLVRYSLKGQGVNNAECLYDCWIAHSWQIVSIYCNVNFQYTFKLVYSIHKQENSVLIWFFFFFWSVVYSPKSGVSSHCTLTICPKGLEVWTLKILCTVIMLNAYCQTAHSWRRTVSVHFQIGTHRVKLTSKHCENLCKLCAWVRSMSAWLYHYTVKPPNRGHFGVRPFVPCREVVLFSEVLF